MPCWPDTACVSVYSTDNSNKVSKYNTVKAEIFDGVIFSVFSKIGGSVEGNFR